MKNKLFALITIFSTLALLTLGAMLLGGQQSEIGGLITINGQKPSIAVPDFRASGDAQIAAALASVPGSKLFVYEIPLEPDDAVRVHLYSPEGTGLIVYVHPETLAVLKSVPHTHRLTEIVRMIHAELLAGRTGAILIELAAGWAQARLIPQINYGGTFSNLFNGNNPDRGVGVNITVPLRNRPAQALHERSLLEFRQDQLKLQQLYTQIRMGVVNAQYALTNDRAAVQAAAAAREYNGQALDAEKKKFKYGASTTALVLQQERNLAAAENTVTAAMATYAKDRAALEQILANTLTKYNISIGDGVSGTVTQQVTIPGLEAAPNTPAAPLPSQQQQLHTPPVVPPPPPMAPAQPQQPQPPPQ